MAVIVVFVDGAGQVLGVGSRPEEGTIEQGGLAYKAYSFVSGLIKQSKPGALSFEFQKATIEYAVHTSPVISPEDRAEAIQILRDAVPLDSISVVTVVAPPPPDPAPVVVAQPVPVVQAGVSVTVAQPPTVIAPVAAGAGPLPVARGEGGVLARYVDP